MAIPADSAEARHETSAPDVRPRHLLPLIRHVSCRVSPWLARTPITANQITVLGTIVGLLGVWCFLQDGVAMRLAGAAAIAFTYLCDHCDGEVARLKRIESNLGDLLSEVGGALVHGGLFLGLGWKASVVLGDTIWFWFGVATALGAFMNLVVALLVKEQPAEQELAASDLSQSVRPTHFENSLGWRDKAIYVFRELLRADLWIVLVVLGVLDLLWILLPAAAVGSHVFWIAGLTRNARKYHV